MQYRHQLLHGRPRTVNGFSVFIEVLRSNGKLSISIFKQNWTILKEAFMSQFVFADLHAQASVLPGSKEQQQG
jgi:hypothetical protein